MKISPAILRQILIQSGFVSEKNFDAAQQTAQDVDKTITDILLFRGLINEMVLGQLIADYYKVPYIHIGNKVLPLEVLDLVPENLARSYHMLPFEKQQDTLLLAMEDPTDLESMEVVRRKTGLRVVPHFITTPDYKHALSQYRKNIKKEFETIIRENVEKTSKATKDKGLSEVAEELPVIEILNTILEYAIAERASDVHIEIMNDILIMRLRIDGVLRDVISLPKTVHPGLIARIKILANLKIDEHRVPQDGRFKFNYGEESIALRVSIVPGFYGENTVLRLLPESARPLSLEELGLTGTNLEWVQQQFKKPHGMILVTGPTGSGKTTTLYSILNILNNVNVKICTIEDPVEYDIRRVTQIQVNPITGLTFAIGLRALMRHDPNIIMVGEIRDRETAEIAIHSALTGHLVLSTLHTNDAASAIPRFIDMGVEPFLVASTVNMIIAQRLVRKICPNCIDHIEPPVETLNFFMKELGLDISKQKFYKGKGCEECGNTGYKGRIGIYEILVVKENIRQKTLSKSSSETLCQEAKKNGMILMLDDGLNKVASGITTIEEVLRVAKT